MTARLAQGKEHRPSKPTVDGSSPSARTTRPQDAATEALDRLVEKFMAETQPVSNARSWARVYMDGDGNLRSEQVQPYKRPAWWRRVYLWLVRLGYVIRKARKSG